MSAKKTSSKIIANAAQLIEALAQAGSLSPSEAATAIGIPRSSAYRLINGLATTDLIEPVGDGRVRLSPRWLRLSEAARSALVEWKDAPQLLQHLVDRTNETAYLSVPTGESAMCIDWRRGRGVDVLAFRPARRLPLNAGPAGRIFLAFINDGSTFENGSDSMRFEALTPLTLTDPDTLRRDVEATRRRGYVLARQDVSTGIDAVGVPVHRPDGSVAGCLSLAGSSAAFDRESDFFVAELQECAAKLGQWL